MNQPFGTCFLCSLIIKTKGLNFQILWEKTNLYPIGVSALERGALWVWVVLLWTSNKETTSTKYLLTPLSISLHDIYFGNVGIARKKKTRKSWSKIWRGRYTGCLGSYMYLERHRGMLVKPSLTVLIIDIFGSVAETNKTSWFHLFLWNGGFLNIFFLYHPLRLKPKVEIAKPPNFLFSFKIASLSDVAVQRRWSIVSQFYQRNMVLSNNKTYILLQNFILHTQRCSIYRVFFSLGLPLKS